ncbi:MAG: 5'-methylthioadenosine/adenosylhomocysteine nucleosidase [Treponemataceae bacterium]|nr:5'-methylthioadenosine/adenosylhomocysteine nucleosidase [Treponemataceae bacterium]
MKRIGIIGAMDMEIAILRDKMKKSGGAREIEAGGFTFYEGSVNGTSAVIVKSGVGKVNAALCAQLLITQFKPDAVVNTGVAGALSPGLGIFDIVVSTDAVYHDMDASVFGYKPTEIPQMKISAFPADKALIETAERAFAVSSGRLEHKIMRGRIATGDQFVASADVKKRIIENCAPACVEMEGAGIAHCCFLNNVPFVILRCLSDMADASVSTTYKFNEKSAAEESASVIIGMLSILAEQKES